MSYDKSPSWDDFGDAKSVAIDRAAGPLPRTKTSHSSCSVGVDSAVLTVAVAASEEVGLLLEEDIINDC